MKKILFIILGLLLLAAIGAGAYFFFQKKTGGETPGLSFFGFGGREDIGDDAPVVDPGQQASSTDQTAVATAVYVKKIHAAPVAGFGVDIDTSKNTIVRYQEKALGHMYEMFLWDGVEASVSSNTEPTVYSSLFGENGDMVLMRTLNANSAMQTTALRVASGVHMTLPKGTIDVAISPDKKSVFTLALSENGSSGSISALDGAGKRGVFSSSFREWLPAWTSPSFITLATKPSARVNGSLYLLNTRTLASQIAVAGKPGLTGTLSPDGKTLVFSESAGGGMRTSYYTIASGKTMAAPFTTLPEKCAWSTKEVGTIFCAIPFNIPAAEHPDSWYRGDISFSDSIWKFNTQSTEDLGRVVIDRVPGESVDAVSLALDAEENYLLFINKKDGALWAVDLSQAAPRDID